jgi:hypothetical protein
MGVGAPLLPTREARPITIYIKVPLSLPLAQKHILRK